MTWRRSKAGEGRKRREMKFTNVRNYSLEGDSTFLSFSTIGIGAVLEKKNRGAQFKIKCKVTVPLRFISGFTESRESLKYVFMKSGFGCDYRDVLFTET